MANNRSQYSHHQRRKQQQQQQQRENHYVHRHRQRHNCLHRHHNPHPDHSPLATTTTAITNYSPLWTRAFFVFLIIINSINGLDVRSDREILSQLYFVTAGDEWTKHSHWLDSEVSICQWEGIRCYTDPDDSNDGADDQERVQAILLSNNNLKGELPITSLLQLPFLRSLKLDNNPITYPHDVVREDLYEENAEGIESGLSQLDLSHTDLYSLQSLTGKDNFVNFFELSKLMLNDCQLEGTFPEGILQMDSLVELSMDRNHLEGPIPETLASQLDKMEYLSLRDNKFTAIPLTLSELSALEILTLSGNPFNVPIPLFLGGMTSLVELDLSSCGFTGPLLPFTQLSSLTLLDVSHNKLTGSVPSTFLCCLTKMDSIVKIDLGDNNLSGSIDTSPFMQFPVGSYLLYDNKFDSLDDNLCHDDYPCHRIVCPPKTYNSKLGRSSGNDNDCLTCPSVSYYGATACLAGSPSTPVVPTTPPPPPSSSPLTPRAILEKLYQDTGGDGWKRNLHWNEDSVSICSWEGLECSDPSNENTLEKIQLVDNDLVGEFPTEVYSLPSLRQLYLTRNKVKFSFEGIGAAATTLEVLDLGEVALLSLKGLEMASGLQELDLSRTELSGPLPSVFFSLTKLRQLALQHNRFSGEIPSSVGDWRHLVSLQTLLLGGNNFKGSLPQKLYQLQELTVLDLRRNQFSGELPSFLNDMTSLTELDLSHNRFSGGLPVLNHLHKLTHLDLSYNELTGSLPDEFLHVPLQQFYGSLASNSLQGGIPSSLSSLDINFVNNQFTSVTTEYCSALPDGQLYTSYQCDAVVCPIGTWNAEGRQREQTETCVVCPTANYLGSTSCPVAPPTPEGPRPPRPTPSTPTAAPGVSPREILERLYYSTDGEAWTESDQWLSEKSCCLWHGVRCTKNDDESTIVEITLRSNGLDGAVPPQIFLLDKLAILNLDGNNVNVDFSLLSHATSLISLDVSHITLPDLKGLEDGVHLTELYLSGNALAGSFPTEIMALVSLKRLSMAQNHFEGSLPDLSSLGGLEFLSIHDNHFTGVIPPTIGNLDKLLFLMMQNNAFSGNIPSEMLKLSSLWFLNLSNQKEKDGVGLKGPLPSFANFHEMRRFDVSHNSLTGVIPPDFLQNVNMEGFEYVDASSNFLEGELPNFLPAAALDQLLFQDNHIKSLENSLCQRSEYPSGDKYCHDVLCPPGTYNLHGRLYDTDDCKVCSINPPSEYYGATTCGNAQGGVPSLSPAAPPSPPTTVETPVAGEKDILMSFYDSTSGDKWHRRDDWLTNPNHCKWFGVYCTEITSTEQVSSGVMAVSKIMLSGNNLIGTPPPELFQLPHLQELVLDDNPILFSFKGIEYATKLSMLSTSATGMVSLVGVENATTLISLFMDDNSFEGELPHELFQLTNLQELSLDDNSFSGSLPTQVGDLVNLKLLSITGNYLTGILPTEVGRLEQLVTLHLHDNSFGGSVPSTIDQLKKLSYLDLSYQTKLGDGFTGSIPPIASLRNLHKVDFSFNHLSGSLPPNFLNKANAGYLSLVDLSHNKFEGDIPPSLANTLSTIPLYTDNKFTALPQQICDLDPLFGCNGILCPIGTCNCDGRVTDVNNICNSCPWATYMGSTQCHGPPVPTNAPIETNPPLTGPTRPPITMPEGAPITTLSERDILIKLYNEMGGKDWKLSENWTRSDISFCDWHGITCVKNKESVQFLSLTHGNLQGTLPYEVYQLPNLAKLSLYNNPLKSFSFYGVEHAEYLFRIELDETQIDSVWGVQRAPSLREFTLSRNKFQTFPEEIYSLEKLHLLDLGRNNMTGTLPNDLATFPKLKYLLLSNNHLSGPLIPIPVTLRYVDLSRNLLTGTIPDGFLNVNTITIDLSRNRLSGTLPIALAKVKTLSLDISDNYITGIAAGLCDQEKWNEGFVKKYGCHALLCPPGYFAPLGRQTSKSFCSPCSENKFYGQSYCDSIMPEAGWSDYESTSFILASLLTFIFCCVICIFWCEGDNIGEDVSEDPRSAEALLLT